MNVLFMGAMSLRFLGLVLFFQLFKPSFIFGGAVACYFSVCLGEIFLLSFLVLGVRGESWVMSYFFLNDGNLRPWKYLSLFVEV